MKHGLAVRGVKAKPARAAKRWAAAAGLGHASMPEATI